MDKPAIPTLQQLLDKAKSLVVGQTHGSAGLLAQALDVQQQQEIVAKQQPEP
ncbi:MAG: hypothetical protein KME45_26765 [Stenomitos rutilans HA7619-LM2]|jgi:hypothetical protein|nr:hypothetical protein [Stenomitos rutilans HA7619-LM2]